MQRCVVACPGGVTIPLGANERKRWSTNLRSATRLPPRLPAPPRASPPASLPPHPSCQVVAVQQNKANHGPTRVLAVSLMRECCVVPASVCKCLPAPANPSFTMPVLKRLSDPGSVRSQVSCCCSGCVSVLMCMPRARLSACFRLLFQALLHFEGCVFLLLFAEETPVDLTCCCLLDAPKQACFAAFLCAVCALTVLTAAGISAQLVFK